MASPAGALTPNRALDPEVGPDPMADLTNGNDETDGLGRHPWRADRYTIARTRRTVRTASATRLRASVLAALDHTETLIAAAERQAWSEWLAQRAQGAASTVTVIGQTLDA